MFYPLFYPITSGNIFGEEVTNDSLIILYLLDISSICPLKYKISSLIFINYLSTIDIAVDYEKVERVKQLLISKWGMNKVCQCSNLMGFTRNVLFVELANAWGLDKELISSIYKKVVQNRYADFNDFIYSDKEIEFLAVENDDIRKFFSVAENLMPVLRGLTSRDYEFALSNHDMRESIPFKYTRKGKIISAYRVKDLNELGYTTIRIIPIENSSTQSKYQEKIKSVKSTDIDWKSISLNDNTVYEMLGRGESKDILHYTGEIFIKSLSEFNPLDFDDLIVFFCACRGSNMKNGIFKEVQKRRINYLTKQTTDFNCDDLEELIKWRPIAVGQAIAFYRSAYIKAYYPDVFESVNMEENKKYEEG